MADIAMAINRYSGGQDGGERTEETTFVDVTLWGKQAETANQYLAKGREVFIEGRLHLDSWEDKASGQKRSKLKVVGESMQFIGRKPAENGEERQERPFGGRKEQASQASKTDEDWNAMDKEEDDIPF